MRKINSDYKTAFVSEAGSEAINNDYFGFVELDNFACYVIADGLYSGLDSTSARLAIETVITKFQENPSIRKSALKGYMKAANNKLLKSNARRRSLKASITIVVTNYEFMRYCMAGNTRMTMYRGNSSHIRSTDNSLAQDMVRKENGPQDKLSRHIERNNMYTYLGQARGFDPFVSKKIRLQDSDVITLFTRGIWENVDEGELLDVFSEADDEPQNSVDTVEELLLSRQPEILENYTFVAIFANKVFADPERKKKRKKIIIITLIVLLLAIIVTVVIILWTRHIRQLRADMNDYFSSAIAGIESGSFSRALTEATNARDLARRLRDNDKVSEIDAHIRMIDSVLRGDDLFDSSRFQEAQDEFIEAIGYSADIGNLGIGLINSRLQATEDFIHFFSLIELADSLAQLGNYEVALSLYTEARGVASSLFFSDGRQQAIDGIALMLERITQEEEAAAAQAAADERAAQQAADERAADALAAAELLSQGDLFFLDGDFVASIAFFQNARAMFRELGDIPGADIANARLELAISRLADRELQESLAEDYAPSGDQRFALGDYIGAVRYYTLARQLFLNLGIEWRVTQLDGQLEAAQQALEQQDEQQQAANREQTERQRRWEQAEEYARFGIEYFRQNEYAVSLQLFRQAGRIFDELGIAQRVVDMDIWIAAAESAMAPNEIEDAA